jgi:hypothetical protein
MRATRIGDCVIETISHDSPTSCIQVPRFDAIVAIQSARNTAERSGASEENDEALRVG